MHELISKENSSKAAFHESEKQAGTVLSDSAFASNTETALINRLASEKLLSSRPEHQLISFQNAPETKLARYGTAAYKSLLYLPEGTYDAVVHNLKNPLQAAQTVGMGAGMAFVLKTVLPEGGLAGKLAAASIGLYFTYKAAEPIYDGFKKAGNATSMFELDSASKQIGGAGGTFIVDSALAAAGYKIGSHFTGLLLSSKYMDGFADAKAGFYDKLAGEFSQKYFPELKPEAQLRNSSKLSARTVLESGPQELKGFKVDGASFSELAADTNMKLTVMLKSRASDLRYQRTLARIAEGRQAPLTEPEFQKIFGASTESANALSKFANENGLKVSELNLSSGRAVLEGNASQISKAFNTKLGEYKSANGLMLRVAENPSISQELSKHLTGILGLDERAKFKSNVANTQHLPAAELAGRRGYMPNEIADAYEFPRDSMGRGQAVAIIQLGGGLDPVDNARYYSSRNLPQPKIKVIEIEPAKNQPGHPFDSEVVLDSQILGVVAPEATQKIIFAPNSEKGFVDAINRATFPEKGEINNSVISISWGLNEAGWSKQGIQSMNQAFKNAALKGISIFASAGDDGALDRSTNGRLQAHYPASDPHVTAVGGTRLILSEHGKILNEHVWNNGGRNDAGGGGISEAFPPQEFQKNANIPPHANTGKAGRGVPDLAGNADPKTGYIIRLHGSDQIMGGTSAAAPLYAGLMLRINGALEKPFSTPLNPWLYKNAGTGIFNDILIGDNNGYKAGPGWDAASGLGSLNGTRLLAAIKADPHVTPGSGSFSSGSFKTW